MVARDNWQTVPREPTPRPVASKLAPLKKTDEERVRYYLDFARQRCRFELANDRLPTR